MDTSRIDLNLLVTLEALITESNVTRASRRLHLSQPAVSAQLSRLRDIFGDPLLVPTHRGMIPTATAVEMLPSIRAALDQLRHTIDVHRGFSPSDADFTLTVACTDYVQAIVITPLMASLRAAAPKVRLAIKHLNPPLLEEHLTRAEIDVAVATPDPDNLRLRYEVLFDESYVLIGRCGHPGLKEGMTIEEFVRLDFVIVSPSGSSFRSPIDDALSTLGYQRNVVMSAASFLFLPEIVACSDLVAMLPRRLLQRMDRRLSAVDLPWLGERFRVGMIWHDRTHHHAGHRWLREEIRRLAKTETDLRP